MLRALQSQVDPGIQAGLIVGMPQSGTQSETCTYNAPHPLLESVRESPIWTLGRQSPVGLPRVCAWASLLVPAGAGQANQPIRGKSQGETVGSIFVQGLVPLVVQPLLAPRCSSH